MRRSILSMISLMVGGGLSMPREVTMASDGGIIESRAPRYKGTQQNHGYLGCSKKPTSHAALKRAATKRKNIRARSAK